MTLPVLKVEIGFGYTAVDTITWTDVTAYVRGFTSQRGRSTELDSMQTGSCTILLNNRTRRFDPEYAAGPYYANLVNNVPVRVTCTHTAVTYNLFYGYVDGWPQTYEPVGDSTVALSCSDAFGLFNRWRLPESVYAYEVSVDNPKVFYGLAEADGVAIDGSGNSHDGVYGGDESASGSLIAGSSDGATLFGGATGSLVRTGDTTAFVSVDPVAVEMWVQADVPPLFLFMQGASGDTDKIVLYVDSSNAIQASTSAAFNAAAEVLSTWITADSRPSAIVADGTPHHLVYRRTATHEMFVDGVSVYREIVAGSLLTGVTQRVLSVGGTAEFGFPWAPHVADGFALYDTSLSDARIAAHYTAGVAPWVGDNTGTRLGRVLDVIGWPAGLRSIDTGETILGPATLAGSTVLDYATQIADTEQARMFMGPDGKVVFQQRDHDQSLTSQATFTDDGTNVDYLTSGFRFAKDAAFTFSEVTGSRAGSSTKVTVSTGDSVVVSKSLTGLLVQTDAEVRNITESFLWRYKTPTTRVDSWTVRPEKRPAKWPTVLGLEIGERVTLQRTPMKLGAQISKDFVIESIAVNAIPGDWTISYTGSPVDGTSYFKWGTSNWGGSDVWR